MNAPFPFGLPLASAFYLTLLVVTLVVHVLFMNYVLAGAAWLAVAGLRVRLMKKAPQALASLLRDWLPFALGMAITAGVAPLLFVQIVYQESFYVANLLLLHRWMAVLPVLIVAYYLLYLLKTGWAGARAVRRGTLAVLVALCFFFVAWSWTENHLLSLQDRATWEALYEQQRMLYTDGRVLPRVLLWGLGSLTTLAMLAGWQLRFAARRGKTSDGTPLTDESLRHATRHLATLALAGLVLAAVAAAIYPWLDPGARAAVTGVLGAPYLFGAIGGLVLQGLAWVWIRRRQQLAGGWLALATVGWAVTALGMTVAREAIRLSAIDVAALLPRHQRALEVGGLTVFLLFAVVMIVVLTMCLRRVRRAIRPVQGEDGS